MPRPAVFGASGSAHDDPGIKSPRAEDAGGGTENKNGHSGSPAKVQRGNLQPNGLAVSSRGSSESSSATPGKSRHILYCSL